MSNTAAGQIRVHGFPEWTGDNALEERVNVSAQADGPPRPTNYNPPPH